MYHPSYLHPKTILKIQTSQRSVTLPLADHLRISLDTAVTLRDRGEEAGNDSMFSRGHDLVNEYAEQIRILENITNEGREAYEEILKLDS